MTDFKIILEVCAGSLQDAIVASEAGADRIELNSGLQLGGLTPSAGLVREVLSAVKIPVIAMVRPRPGGFCYSESEWKTLLADADWLLAEGVHGLAFGVLDEKSNIDVHRCKELVKKCSGAELVFHRAFDLVHGWRVSLQQLMDCGIRRVMTSGQSATAVIGTQNIREMIKWAKGRIEILPASGINIQFIPSLIEQTGATQLHGSFSSAIDDPGYPPENGIRFAPNDELRRANKQQIVEIVQLLKQITG